MHGWHLHAALAAAYWLSSHGRARSHRDFWTCSTQKEVSEGTVEGLAWCIALEKEEHVVHVQTGL